MNIEEDRIGKKTDLKMNDMAFFVKDEDFRFTRTLITSLRCHMTLFLNRGSMDETKVKYNYNITKWNL